MDGRPVATLYGPFGDFYAGTFGPLPAGDHTYTIQAVDSKGLASRADGVFQVKHVIGNGAPAAIFNVVLAESPTNQILNGASWKPDGVPTSREAVNVTWTLSDPDGIESKSISIDGTPVTLIYGPYGANYSAVALPLPQGSHTFTIRAIDNEGLESRYDSTFYVAAGLTLDAPSPSVQAAPSPLTNAQLTPIVAEAARRMTVQFGGQATAVLTGVSVQIADLPGNLLGTTVGKTIRIDRDAAGYGWFVDPTPGDGAEFIDLLSAHSSMVRKNTATDGRADLLTAVMHEMGHVLGYDDQAAADDLMSALLPLATRRT